jgi:transcriptional activator of cad operon
MERAPTTRLRIGAWCVDPVSGQLSRDGDSARLEVRTLRLLMCLAAHAGEVVSIEALLDEVWSGVTVTPDSVYQAVASLRRLLGDDPKQPTYIATVPRLGYRMVAPVGPWADPAVESAKPVPTMRATIAIGAAGAVCLAIAALLLLRGRVMTSGAPAPAADAQTQKSIAVLPFLDLTDAMTQEPFADGMTEELIDRLSRIPGLRVPAPTSSFSFKGKHLPVGDIARRLGVAYVLDGSVRKAGARLRVAARLVRGDNGFVVWSETYDRPFDDILVVQDEIAGEVTKALSASIGAAGRSGTTLFLGHALPEFLESG